MSVLVEVILTYRNSPQGIQRFKVNTSISEKEFVRQIFSMSPNLQNLFKISCCQIILNDREPILSFLTQNNGKYYFNTEVNKDEETKCWCHIKQSYIDEHRM